MGLIKPVSLVKPSGSGPEYDQMTCNSTVIAGDLLVKANNTAAVCATSATNVSYFSQETGTSTVPGLSTILLARVRAADVYEMNAYHATPASATVAATDLDGQVDYGIIFATVSSVPAWFINLQDTNTKCVRIIDNVDSALTVTYPRCRVQFLGTILTF